MLGLIFEYVNLYPWCQILAKFDVNQIWLTTWLFVYVPESDHKTDPSKKKKSVLWADMSDYVKLVKLLDNYSNLCMWTNTVKLLKIRSPEKIAIFTYKIWTKWLYCTIMRPKSADRMANRVDPDQTSPLGAVWSGSTLFAQTCLSENLGTVYRMST